MGLKIGLIREGKTPPDKRVPLTPVQCAIVKERFPSVDLVVQTSPVRAFTDDDYRAEGIQVVDSIADCDVVFGVKEVNIPDLIDNKHFFFFSHTIKKQPYNRKLLQAIIEKKIQLTDYEVLTDSKGLRLIGFGRYAGIVGCYNGFRAYGLKHGLYELKPANQCFDRKEMEGELKKVKLPTNTKIVLTGFGRVGNGAREIMALLPIVEVSPVEFLTENFNSPVFTHLNVEDYNEREDGKPFEKADFYSSGKGHRSTFPKYLAHADMYVACHFWKSTAPFLFTRDDLKQSNVRTSVVADISCDIDGPVACTIRPSTIADPIYGYDPSTESEADFQQDGVITVMAVDNLPCELPRDASEDFGNELITKILPALLGDDPTNIIARGTETKDGKLTSYFSYLQNYLDGKE
jgi:saccharopine dehydrogenase (NAD+, L-lysine-forming)